jgi:tetratricopeptide (TPR) repeat protein
MGLFLLACSPHLTAQDNQDNQPRVEPRSGTSTPAKTRPQTRPAQPQEQQPEQQGQTAGQNTDSQGSERQTTDRQSTDRQTADRQSTEQGESSSKDSLVDFNSTSRANLPAPSNDGADEKVFLPWDPHRAAKDVEVGEYYLKLKNYRAALERFNDALRYKPNDADATFDLAVTQEKLDLFEKARNNYKKYLELLPAGPKAKECQEGIKRLEARGGATPSTDDDVRKAAEDIDAGETYLAKNSYDAARERFEEALRLSPDNPRACFRLAQSLQGLQRPEPARLYYQKYLDLAPRGPYAADARKAIADITYFVGK